MNTSPDFVIRKVLSIPGVKQELPDWCWATCAVMVLHHLAHADVTPVDVADFLFSQSGAAAHASVSKPCTWDDIKKIYSHWHLKCTLRRGIPQFSTIVAEVIAGLPVQVGYEWAGGEGHVALVTGYKTGKSGAKYLYANDPLYGNAWHLYRDMKKGLSIRQWKYYWIFR